MDGYVDGNDLYQRQPEIRANADHIDIFCIYKLINSLYLSSGTNLVSDGNFQRVNTKIIIAFGMHSILMDRERTAKYFMNSFTIEVVASNKLNP